MPFKRNLKTTGLISIEPIAKIRAGTITNPSKSRLKLAPMLEEEQKLRKSL